MLGGPRYFGFGQRMLLLFGGGRNYVCQKRESFLGRFRSWKWEGRVN